MKLIDHLQRGGKETALISGASIVLALFFRWIMPIPGAGNGFMIAAALVAGLPIAATALSALRVRHVSIDLLVVVAAAGALAIGEYWEAASVTFLFDLGGFLEARTMSRTRAVIRELLDLTPQRAIVLRDGGQHSVAAEELKAGDTILIKPGSKVAADGIVEAGESAVDESAITGESLPHMKRSGDALYAGTVNESGLLTVRVTGAGGDTTLARIIARVEEAQEAKAPTQRLMERFSRWYTPFIIILALAVFVTTRDVALALTVLVIGCPGALVISTPVSVIAAIGGAARRGILMKGGAHLEESGRITAVAFDKTGTLTEGRPEVVDVQALFDAASLPPIDGVESHEAVERTTSANAVGPVAKGGGPPAERALRWAAVAEQSSEHPLAKAIMRKAEQSGPLPTPSAAEALPGLGIRARYAGRSIAVGSRRFMAESGICGSEASCRVPAAREEGAEVIAAVDGVPVAVIAVADPLRAEAARAVRRLAQSGVNEIVMLTGDGERTARAVAEWVGISAVFAGLLPEEKLVQIEALRKRGRIVAMVGDGINDAPALAAANVGIAMGAAGSDVAIETADIALMRSDLESVAEAIARSRMASRTIRQNVTIALLTVAALLAGVLLGSVHMAGGMLIHEASVLVVILNAMRQLRR